MKGMIFLRYAPVIHEHIFADERPFDSCHASTLAILGNGEDIVAAWFGGTREGAGDVAIWLSRRIGGRWEAPRKVADIDGVPHWNPVLMRRSDGQLNLYYKVGQHIPTWRTMVTTSVDDGVTWSASQELVRGDIGGRGPVKNKCLTLKDGTWLAPASLEGEYWDAFVDISRDQGLSWEKSQLVPVQHGSHDGETVDSDLPVPKQSFQGKGVIQPTLWESETGVHMLLRSTEGCIYRSDSTDGGLTWCPAYATGLPNNNSGIDLVKLDNGFLVLAYNPVGQNWGPRTPLMISTSADNGLTWDAGYVLENQPGEYSYPAIVANGSDVFVTYTWKRERIAFWRIHIEDEM